MYLHHLRVKNLKLIREMQVPFLHDGKPRPWTVFVGENGFCKTTLLRAIALAASGPERGNQLADFFLPTMPDKRVPDSLTEIEATFGFGSVAIWPSMPPSASKQSFRLRSHVATSAQTGVLRGSSRYVGDDGQDIPLVMDDGAVLPDPLQTARAGDGTPTWFVAGYGVGRSLPQPTSTAGRTYVAPLDRLRSLFGGPTLIATDFASRFDAETTRAFSAELKKAFVASGLLPNIDDIDLRGRSGVADAHALVASHRFDWRVPSGEVLRLPALWLSEGYQTTIAWIADLVGQLWTDARRIVPLNLLEGLVLIDEIDLHLHPTWQRDLVRVLRSVFPRLQFVVTTHSPMVLPGFEPHEIFILKQKNDGSIEWEQSRQKPRQLTGGELLERFFDIGSVYPEEDGVRLHRYLRLASDPTRSEDEEKEMQDLRQQLSTADIPVAYEPVPRSKP